ncbi:hypothetical protein [Paenibacillus alvei]|uniref:hypothetical protein n=1 Tax=Paenibacillus alvei TaxID=44250 RepID=UPI00227DBC9C|nr:hypothetical protein [Paenibacillus alvei]MCY7487886.1 hypothetical protein [Paenibacillus alvei]
MANNPYVTKNKANEDEAENHIKIPVPNDLRQWIIHRMTLLCETLRNGAAAGNPAFQMMVDEGHVAHYESEIRFVTIHFEDWN